MRIVAGQRIIAWDVGIHDLSVCVVDVIERESLPIPHIAAWTVNDICPRVRAPMDEVCRELVNFWMREATLLASADVHVIEIQFHNPKMRALSHCIQTLVLTQSTAEVVFMGSDTKFAMCRRLGVPIAAHEPSRKRRRTTTKSNSLIFAEWILKTLPSCSDNCSQCANRASLYSQIENAVASKKDDLADSLGLGYTAMVKYWQPTPGMSV